VTCNEARLKDFHAVHRSLKPLSSVLLSEASYNKIVSQASSNSLGFLGGFRNSEIELANECQKQSPNEKSAAELHVDTS